MKRTRNSWLLLLAVLVLLFGTALAIRAQMPKQLTAAEIALLREEVIDWWGTDEEFYADVLYDSQGSPMWMYGESLGGSVILNRVTRAFSEAGELRYYGEYHDARKYYAAPMSHIVEARNVPTETDSADDGYYLMTPSTHLDTFRPTVPGWIWSNLKLPFEALKCLLSGNPLPR